MCTLEEAVGLASKVQLALLLAGAGAHIRGVGSFGQLTMHTLVVYSEDVCGARVDIQLVPRHGKPFGDVSVRFASSSQTVTFDNVLDAIDHIPDYVNHITA